MCERRTQSRATATSAKSKARVFDLAALNPVAPVVQADGTAIGSGSLAGKLYVNSNDGVVWQVDMTTGDCVQVAVGGTRGDFATPDPTNGSLLLTQSTTIMRLTPPSGGRFGQTPPAPLGLRATPGNAQVSLAWNPVPGATAYTLWRGTAPGTERNSPPVATNITGLTWVDPGLTNGQTYYYVVSAVGVFGTGPTSNEASATPSGGLPLPVNAAAFVSQGVPASMNAGQQYPVTVTMRNTGTSVWTAAGLYLLGSQADQDNRRWGLGRVALPGTPPGPVQPGATAAFTFSVTAPAAPGNYAFQWRMVQEGVQWFGDFTPDVAVTVGPAVVAPVAPVCDLAAAATGSDKITLYWNGYAGAIGYNVYQSQQFDGPFTKINLSGPVTTPDNSAGITNEYMYTDSPLATGTEYFYYVAPVLPDATEAGRSNEESDTPDGTAVPWDTADPTQIINAVSATAALDLEPDYDDSGDSYPAQVGVLEVAGPDGAVYMGDFPDGSPAQAFMSHAYTQNGSVYYDDGVITALPNDYDPNAVAVSSQATPLSAGPTMQAGPISDYSPFPATHGPTGIYREVVSFPGYVGFSATVGLPDPLDINSVFLNDWFSTSASGAPDFNKYYSDSIDVYTGGFAYYPSGTNWHGTAPLNFPLDAGVVTRRVQYDLGPGLESIFVPSQWTPFAGNPSYTPHVMLDGSTKALPSGKQKGAEEYREYLSGEVRMQLLTPGSPHIHKESVELHFSLPQLGTGTGRIDVLTVKPSSDPYNPANWIKTQSVNEITLVYSHILGWLKKPVANHPEYGSSQFVIKRVTSLAQTLRTPSPTTPADFINNQSHPGAPLANAPINQVIKGYLTDGSYVVAPAGSGDFGGVYWGNLGDALGVELLVQPGGWWPWTDDPSVTGAAGAFPSGYNYVVNWLNQLPYFWETQDSLYAR